MKIIVAMSGGVDSSVVAHMLKEEGHEVIGLSFELWDKRDLKSSNVCCSVETIQLARSVAESLGIEHHTVDVRDTFYKYVIEDFCDSYIRGVTPNPCILCNKYIKFDFLLQKARELGADRVATGHYAQTDRGRALPAGRQVSGRACRQAGVGDQVVANERYLLKKGVDPKKDQSYVLYVMQQDELVKTLFPLGELKKEKTRALAAGIGLANATRPESQEICFVGDDNYADFIKEFSPESVQPGHIVDSSGRVMGEHTGIAFYTIGQRRGLGIAAPEPLYVINIDRKDNRLVIGQREEAMRKTFQVKELNWVSVSSIEEPIKAHVKMRSTMKEEPAMISPEPDGRVSVEYDELQWAPASGQSAVFYYDDVVLGGGIID
jgi:tRNA-specific 2-thiouridylase